MPFLSPGDLPHPGIEPKPPASQADSLPAEPPGKPKKTERGPLLIKVLLHQALSADSLKNVITSVLEIIPILHIIKQIQRGDVARKKVLPV